MGIPRKGVINKSPNEIGSRSIISLLIKGLKPESVHKEFSMFEYKYYIGF